MNQTQTNRIEVVDALRGLALCAIVIVHCFEHYNLYYIPESAPQWLTALDREVWNTTWFLLAGKAFSTFSLLFGFSFFIQLDNAARRGMPFRGRFVWRMFLLLLFSQLHSLFYNGDILLLYSVMGLLLVALCRLSTRVVLTVAVIMILQPLEWIRLLCALLDIPFLDYGNHWLTYAKLAKPVMESGNQVSASVHSLWQDEPHELYSSVHCRCDSVLWFRFGVVSLYGRHALSADSFGYLYASAPFQPLVAQSSQARTVGMGLEEADLAGS